MSDQALPSPVRAERRRPRRRRTDVNPLLGGVLVAATFALLFHVMPGNDEVHAIRVVLMGTALVTACVLAALLVLERIGRTPSGHSPRNHPRRRSGDRRRK